MSKLHTLLRLFEVAALLLIGLAFVQIAFDINKMSRGINVAAEVRTSVPLGIDITGMPPVDIQSVPMLDMEVNR